LHRFNAPVIDTLAFLVQSGVLNNWVSGGIFSVWSDFGVGVEILGFWGTKLSLKE
jgi:hypothetical protein